MQLMNVFGQDFAAHGTNVISGEEHSRSGMPTGGQGGANFIINNVSEGYGEFGCYIIAKCEHLFADAVRHYADITLNFNKHDSIYFRGKELILELDKKTSENISNLEPYLLNRTDVHLQIRKGDSVRLKVPFVLITSEDYILGNEHLQKSTIQIININNNSFEKTNNIHSFARNLMQTSKGKAYLNKLLN
jgi:hypothetical protein